MKIFSENPVFKLLLGLCPTLAVTTAAFAGLGMGLAVTFVLICSNVLVSLFRNVIPAKIRIPVFIVIIVTFVSIIDMLMSAWLPDLHKTLGIFIPLITVNCIILGRAEAFASRSDWISSLKDGFNNGIAFTVALLLLAAVRELLGNGTIFDYQLMPVNYMPIIIFILPPGAFLVLGTIIAIVNRPRKGVSQ